MSPRQRLGRDKKSLDGHQTGFPRGRGVSLHQTGIHAVANVPPPYSSHQPVFTAPPSFVRATGPRTRKATPARNKPLSSQRAERTCFATPQSTQTIRARAPGKFKLPGASEGNKTVRQSRELWATSGNSIVSKIWRVSISLVVYSIILTLSGWGLMVRWS